MTKIYGVSKIVLGAYAKLRKSTISFDMPLRLSAWNSVLNGRIFMKFDIWIYFEKLSEKIQVSLKSDNNKGYFIWRPLDIVDYLSLSSP